MVLVVKNLPANAGDVRDLGLIPGSGRFPGGGHGNPLQYSCLENPLDRGAYRATVHRVSKTWTWLQWFTTQESIRMSQNSQLVNPWISWSGLFLISHLHLHSGITVQFGTVQSPSRVRLFATPWIAACQASLSITTPGIYSNSCPSSWWCHPAISSSVVPFSSCPQSLQASGSFPMSQLFTWNGQSIRVSASASVLPMNTSPMNRTYLLQDGLVGYPCSPRDSQVFSNTTVQKHQFFGAQLSSQSNSHIHTWLLDKCNSEENCHSTNSPPWVHFLGPAQQITQTWGAWKGRNVFSPISGGEQSETRTSGGPHSLSFASSRFWGHGVVRALGLWLHYSNLQGQHLHIFLFWLHVVTSAVRVWLHLGSIWIMQGSLPKSRSITWWHLQRSLPALSPYEVTSTDFIKALRCGSLVDPSVLFN